MRPRHLVGSGVVLTVALALVGAGAPRLTLQNVWFQGEAQEGTHCALGWGVLSEAVLIFDNASDRMLLVVGAVWKSE